MDGSRDKTHDILTKLKSKENPSEAMILTIANSNSRMYQLTPVDDPHYLCLHHQKIQAKWLSPWNILICKGNLKHNISFEVDRNGNILISFGTYST